MSNLQDWSKQFQQFEQIHFSNKQNQNKNKNQAKKKASNDEWSNYRASASSQSTWGSKQRDPVKELTDIAECRKRRGNDMDHWRFKESKSRFKGGAPGSSRSSMSGSFSRAEKKSSAKTWIILAIVIIFLLNMGISLIGSLFRSLQDSFTEAIQGIELEFVSEPEPDTGMQAPVSIAGEAEGYYERDEDSVYLLKSVTDMDDQQVSDFMDIFEMCTMGAMWDMLRMQTHDQDGLTCYAIYPLWEDGWNENTDMLVWLDDNLAIARLDFLGNTLYDAQRGMITDTMQILYFHDDLEVNTISWGAKSGGGFVSGVVTQTSDTDYACVAPIVVFYDKYGEFINAYHVDAERNADDKWTFSADIADALPWGNVSVEVEGILAYE